MAYAVAYINDFTGGENTEAAPDQLTENQVLLAENVELPLRGGFIKRKGCENITGAQYPYRVMRLIPFSYIDAGAPVYVTLALCDDGKLYRSDAPTVAVYTWGDIHLDYEVVGKKCYLIGAGKYMVWDGLTFSAVTNVNADSNLTVIQKCVLIEQRGQRLFVTGNPDNPNSLYFSEIGDPTYFKTTSEILAVSDDADVITAIKEFFDALVVFKTRAIYAWSGYDPNTDVEFNRLATTAGTRSYRTVQYVDDKLMYLSDDGIYALTGTYKNVINTTKLTLNSTRLIRDIYRPKPIEHAGVTTQIPNYWSPNHAVVYDGKYILSVVTGPTWKAASNAPVPDPEDPEYADYPMKVHDATYIIDLDALAAGVSQFRRYTGWAVNSWCVDERTGDLLGALDTVTTDTGNIGRVRKYFVGYSDAGVAYTVRLRTAAQHQGDPIRRKKYRYAYVWARQYEDIYGSSLAVRAYVDYTDITRDVEIDESGIWDAEDTLWDASKFDFVDLVTRRIAVKARGKRIIFEFTSTAVDEQLQVYGIGVEYKVKKPERQ